MPVFRVEKDTGYIHKSDQRADRLDAARAAIPKETVKIKEKAFDEASGRAKTRVRREVRDKPPPAMKPNPASRPVQEQKKRPGDLVRHRGADVPAALLS